MKRFLFCWFFILFFSYPLFAVEDSLEEIWGYKNPCVINEFKEAFFANHFERVTPSKSPRIPKIIHHIWLGSPLPKKFKIYVESWKKFHPDWEHKIWTDKDFESFPLVSNKAAFLTKNYGQRSDIFRLEILYRYGGLYVDTDFLCLKPHDPIHCACDFYAGMVGRATVSNSFIGSKVGHPILKSYLNALSQVTKFSKTPKEILKESGPFLFTDILKEHLSKTNEGVMIFPIQYYYAFPANLRDKFWRTQNLKLVMPYIPPFAFGIHLFATSWQRPKARKK